MATCRNAKPPLPLKMFPSTWLRSPEIRTGAPSVPHHDVVANRILIAHSDNNSSDAGLLDQVFFYDTSIAFD